MNKINKSYRKQNLLAEVVNKMLKSTLVIIKGFEGCDRMKTFW